MGNTRLAIRAWRFAIRDLLDAVHAKRAFGLVEVTIGDDVVVVVVFLESKGFDDAGGGFVGVGGIVGDLEGGAAT